MDTKCMMFTQNSTRIHEIQEASLWWVGPLSTWCVSLNWASSVGWLNRSVVPVPSWAMEPRGQS